MISLRSGFPLLACAISCATPSRGSGDAVTDSLKLRIAALEAKLAPVVQRLPSKREWLEVPTSLGPLVVSVDSIVTHAAGSRVHLSVGTPAGASIIDLSGTISWGPAGATEAVASRAIVVRATFLHARWTAAFFDLDGVAPAAIGFLRLAGAEPLGVELGQ